MRWGIHWKSAAGRKFAGYHMHLHACPSRRLPRRRHSSALAFTISPYISAYANRTSKATTWLESWCMHHRARHAYREGPGTKSDIHEPNLPSCDPPIDRFIARGCWQGAMSMWCDECLICTYVSPRERHVREALLSLAAVKENSRGDLKLFAQAHSPSASRSDATIPLPKYEPLVNN